MALTNPARLPRGLSHRALGDNTDALCTLVEVLSPFGAMHGKYDENLLIEGDDEVLLSDVASRYATAAGGTLRRKRPPVWCTARPIRWQSPTR